MNAALLASCAQVHIESKKGSPLGLNVAEADSSSTLVPGVFICHIRPGSPAANCGALQVGDLIVSINGVHVSLGADSPATGHSMVGLPLHQVADRLK